MTVEVEGLRDPVEIGRGGFAVVYRATQPALNRQVAVKVLTNRVDPAGRERFTREGHALGRLSGHPNIVNVYDTGITSDDRPFITMAYLPGGSLGERLRAEGALPWAEVVRIGIKLAGALESAHRMGMLHRDVKPENVLLSAYGEPLLADFGIARVEGRFETSTGHTFASLLYAAPEVLDGRPPTPATDVYSLGATLFTLLAGAPPFHRDDEESLAALYVRIATAAPPDLRPRGVPAALADVLERTLAKDPADRPASALELGALLREVEAAQNLAATEVPLAAAVTVDAVTVDAVGGPAAGPAVVPPAARRRRRGPLVGAVVVLVLGAVGAALASKGDGAVPADRIAGSWSGRATFGSGSFDVDLDVTKGCVVDGPCGTIRVSHVPCFGRISLAKVLPDGTFEFNVGDFMPPSDPQECHAGAGDLFKLRDDGTLAYSTTYDESVRAVLRRQGPA